MANYTTFLHKIEVQTVILRWVTGLNLNWFKSYYKKTQKRQMGKDQICTPTGNPKFFHTLYKTNSCLQGH